MHGDQRVACTVQTAEVEAAQQAAQSALMAEMDLVRRQKVALEEHSRRLELQVGPPPLSDLEVPTNY